jgi:hypothetical protein
LGDGEVNIRPYTNALRKSHPKAWRPHYDSVSGGMRTVSLIALFRGDTPVFPIAAGTPVKQGDRLLDIQLSDDGAHRVSHMVVTRDGELASNPSNPKADPAPRFLRGSTYPTDFTTPAEMIAAIDVECARTDHKP